LPYVTCDELRHFYHSIEPHLKASTFDWRIYSLKKTNRLEPVRAGVYTFSVKPPFQPKLKDIAIRLSRQFPAGRQCVEHPLSEWLVHQPGKFLLLVEAEAQ
jgi:hypothetical protein